MSPLLCLGLVCGLIVETSRARPHKEVRELQEDTVLLIEYAYVDMDADGSASDAGSADDGRYRCVLRVRAHRAWQHAEKNGRVVSSYAKEERKESFFFIAPKTEFYHFALYDDYGRKDKALKVSIFEGRKKDPRIFSSADSQGREIHGKMQSAIDYCKSISDIQRFDASEDDEFRQCYKAMERIVFYSVLFKIVTAVTTFFFFNREVRRFYLAKKIIAE